MLTQYNEPVYSQCIKERERHRRYYMETINSCEKSARAVPHKKYPDHDGYPPPLNERGGPMRINR